MRAGAVEVGDVLDQRASEVPLSEDERVVEALASDAAEEALAPAAEAAWAAGHAMTLADAIAFALAEHEGERSAPLTGRAAHAETSDA